MKIDLDDPQDFKQSHAILLTYIDRKGKVQELRIYKKVSAHWEKLARLLDYDVEVIKMGNVFGAENCFHSVLKQWMDTGH